VITKKVAAIFAALGIAVTGVSLVAPASADPVANTYAVVGSDTLEDAVNALVNGTSGNTFRIFSNNSTLGSFDATGNPCIQTKENSSRFTRPNGSSDGLLALVKSMKQEAYNASTSNGRVVCDRNNVRIDGLVDIARSSSNPGTNNPDFTGTGSTDRTLAWFPFGRDAMAYAYRSAVGSTTAAVDRDESTGLASRIASLTKDDLTDIFACTLRQIDGHTITPVVPQAGSGTRSSWLTALGLTEAMMPTVSEGTASITTIVGRDGSGNAITGVVSRTGCVQEGQEHDGQSLKVRNAVMPMSVSRWVAMAQGLTVNKVGSAILAGSSLVAGQEPVTGTGTNMVPNELYYANGTWGRETWLVVEYNRVTLGKPGYDAALANIFDAEQPNSLVNVETFNPNFAGFWKKKFGILPPNSGTLIKHTRALQ
jgi:ABC-type phosphate transport system substrate-binding protein